MEVSASRELAYHCPRASHTDEVKRNNLEHRGYRGRCLKLHRKGSGAKEGQSNELGTIFFDLSQIFNNARMEWFFRSHSVWDQSSSFLFFIRSFEVSCWFSMLANFLLLIKIHVVLVLQEHFKSFQGQWVIKSRDLFLQVPKALGLGPQPLQKWKHIWENWQVESIQNQSVGKRHQKGQALGGILYNGFCACTQGWIQGIWKTQGNLLTTPFNTCLPHLS